MSTAVETVMDSLDEVEGASNLSISSLAEQVTASSLDGLANLQQNFANDSSFDVSQAVNKIAGGAAKGVVLKHAANPNFGFGRHPRQGISECGFQSEQGYQ